MIIVALHLTSDLYKNRDISHLVDLYAKFDEYTLHANGDVVSIMHCLKCFNSTKTSFTSLFRPFGK